MVSFGGEISEKTGNVPHQFGIFGSGGDGSLSGSRAATCAWTIQPGTASGPRTASGERRWPTVDAVWPELEFLIPVGTRLDAVGRGSER